MTRLRISLTGGSGLLALNWAACFGTEHDITLALHRRVVNTDLASVMPADLSQVSGIRRFLQISRPDVLIHTAAMTHVDHCEAQPDLAARVNTDLARDVAHACVAEGVRMVLISTDHLFDGSTALLDETAPVHPINVYARTKVAAEHAVQDILPSALILRTNFFGWGPSYRHSFSDMVIGQIRAGKSVSLFTDTFVTPILAKDLGCAILDLLALDQSGVFNLVGDTRISKHGFGLMLAQQFGLPAQLIQASRLSDRRDLVARPLDMSLSNAKARAILGRPLGSLEHGCEVLALQENTPAIQKMRAL